MKLAATTRPPSWHGVEEVWPLFGLRLRTARLELRPPTDEAIARLAWVARQGVHDPDASPFSSGWTDYPPREFGLQFAQYFWNQRARWTATGWALPFAVYLDGEPVGVQQITATQFPALRTVGTGSWLARSHQGQGIGTEMRTAVLGLAFDHLGAELAVTGAYDHATSSLRVSHKLGYERNGVRRDLVGGRALDAHLFRMTRESWQQRSRPSVHIEGLEGCLHLFTDAAAPPSRPGTAGHVLSWGSSSPA